jgi:hypothetical protein
MGVRLTPILPLGGQAEKGTLVAELEAARAAVAGAEAARAAAAASRDTSRAQLALLEAQLLEARCGTGFSPPPSPRAPGMHPWSNALHGRLDLSAACPWLPHAAPAARL